MTRNSFDVGVHDSMLDEEDVESGGFLQGKVETRLMRSRLSDDSIPTDVMASTKLSHLR